VDFDLQNICLSKKKLLGTQAALRRTQARSNTPGSLMDSSNPQKKGGAETPPSLGRKRPRMWKADLASHEKIATGTAWMLQRRKNSITMMIYTSTTYGSRENADCAAKTEPGFRYAHCPAERREQIVLSA
jgi:hypothetical protein